MSGTQEWTHEELDQWFIDDMGGVDRLESRFKPPESRYGMEDRARPELVSGGGDPDYTQFLTAWNDLWGDKVRDMNPRTPFEGWQGLSLESKAALRRGWEREQAEWAQADADAQAESIVPDLVGPLPPERSRDGAPSQSPESADAPAPASGNRPAPWMLGLGAIGIAVVLVVLLALVLSGGNSGESDERDASAEAPVAAAGIAVAVDGGTATYEGPTTMGAGQAVELVVVVTDENGEPRAGVPWFVTLGDPPGGPDAVHGETETDAGGRAVFRITVPDRPGPNRLWTSDGTSVWEVTPVEVTVEG